MRSSVVARKVLTARDREEALSVVEAVYLQEKSWIRDPGSEIPAEPAARQDHSWFLVAVDGDPLAEEARLEPDRAHYRPGQPIELAQLRLSV